MPSPIQNATQDRVLNEVTVGWYESDLSRFQSSRLPHARVKGSRDNFADTTYRLEELTSNLDNETLGGSWDPGANWPAARPLSENVVTISPSGWISPSPRSFAIPREGGGNRLEHARVAVPVQMSMVWQRRDRLAVAAMVNTTKFGTNNWSGSQVFSAVDTTGDQDPLGDIEGRINTYIGYQNSSLKHICAMDRLTMTALAQKPAFHGAGTGSGEVSRLAFPRIVQILKEQFGYDDVLLFSHFHLQSAPGATASTDFAKATPFFFTGLVDASDSDLRTGTYGPQGAIRPFVDIKEESGSEARVYAGKDEMEVFTPQYDASGVPLGQVITGNFE